MTEKITGRDFYPFLESRTQLIIIWELGTLFPENNRCVQIDKFLQTQSRAQRPTHSYPPTAIPTLKPPHCSWGLQIEI